MGLTPLDCVLVTTKPTDPTPPPGGAEQSASGIFTPAPQSLPYAQVLPLVGVAHLDRTFDYAVADTDPQVGHRVRIRFAGRLIDGIVYARSATTSHTGDVERIHRVIGDGPVFSPSQLELIDTVAAFYAATRPEVIRAALPARHARAETAAGKLELVEPATLPPDTLSTPGPWATYPRAEFFAQAVLAGQAPRGVWHPVFGEDVAARLAELVAVCAAAGGVLVIAPTVRSAEWLATAVAAVCGDEAVVTLMSSHGPEARYRRYSAARLGRRRIVIGTRSAIYAPVEQLRLILIWESGEELLVNPRAPYDSARQVGLLRSQHSGAALLLAGWIRTPEDHLLIDSGWAQPMAPAPQAMRQHAPLIRAQADTDTELDRDQGAHSRLPDRALALLRAALQRNEPVLVQVPRGGYVPAVACGSCRTPARCRHCTGPIAIPSSTDPLQAAVPACAWCGRPEPRFVCPVCGQRRLRAMVVGMERTAEELGRAHPSIPVTRSGGAQIVDTVGPGARIVVATPGAEPTAEQGYGAALLLDGMRLISRPDLRAGELALHAWVRAVQLVRPQQAGGGVFLGAPAEHRSTQALIRGDWAGFAAAELADRQQVHLPPAAAIVVVDGALQALGRFRERLELDPAICEVLGPVPLPVYARGVAGMQPTTPKVRGAEDIDDASAQRLIIRVPRSHRQQLCAAVKAARLARSVDKDTDPIRVMVDPYYFG